MDLKEPKRKRFSGDHLRRPVLIDDISDLSVCKSLWPTAVGYFNGDCVIINNREEISALYNAGCFGKGCYSRAFPCFDKGKLASPPVLQQRQWDRRLSWIKKLSPSTLDGATNESDNIQEHADSSSHVISNSISAQKTPEILSDESMVDAIVNEISISSDDDKESTRSTSRKRKHEFESDLRSKKLTFISDELQPSEETAGLNSKPIELSEDSNSRSKTDENENNPQPLETDDQDIPENSVIVINDVIDYDKCDFEPRLCIESRKTVQETLNLSLEEAFFLSYALRCLQVVDLSGTSLLLTEMWQIYQEAKPTFISSYIVYHHFRSKGWVVKSGLKYGGDFLLYKKGPKFYHASYIVVIQDAGQPTDGSFALNKPFDWTKFVTLQRLAETVSKDVLLCHVQWPTVDDISQFDSPEVVKQFKVQEVIYRRWTSNKNVKDTNN
ncbi:tRNA-splicing endonuclease subunit Sen2 [Nilaparvata lugens]|uniref:tRNA-splicing endonuclease subunit Sen2 n=1 Tax=Nilaparvata lugens TaxID=108931 RepID=UPI00193D6B26|nr:tRNA-splicing endonuclease subunit Sen2 [Nilaparvata lugens]